MEQRRHGHLGAIAGPKLVHGVAHMGFHRFHGHAEVISDQPRFRSYSKEYAELEGTVKCYEQWRRVQDDIEEARSLLKDSDPDLREMAEEDLEANTAQLAELEEELNRLLLPKDPNDDRNVFLEIRAGTGGDEAAIFSGDLFRMYSRYAERQGWRVEVLSENPGEHGGYKEVIARVEGQSVYAKLKFESRFKQRLLLVVLDRRSNWRVSPPEEDKESGAKAAGAGGEDEEDEDEGRSTIATPDGGCLCYVLRTGFSSSQGELMQMIEFSTEQVSADSKETGLALLVLLCFALASAGYVLKKGLEKGDRTTHELLLKCVIIITSVGCSRSARTAFLPPTCARTAASSVRVGPAATRRRAQRREQPWAGSDAV